MDHLRDICRRSGYRPIPAPPPPEDRVPDDLVDTVERVEAALEEEDIGAYLLLLETLFERYDPAEVAAAAVALLRKGVGARSGGSARPSGGSDASEATAASRRDAERDAPLPGGRGTAWVRLFVSVGQKDGASPGDLVGAIAGESGVDGARVGRIEMRDTFSIVEVEDGVAERIIRALNGTTVKGRSVRADYDRGGQRKPKGGRRG
jgi:ATP-dependent RNA helicase DeaD